MASPLDLPCVRCGELFAHENHLLLKPDGRYFGGTYLKPRHAFEAKPVTPKKPILPMDAAALDALLDGIVSPKPVEPDATTWVARDQEGHLRAVKVSEMTDPHIWRWVRYMRRKWRDEKKFIGSDAELDAAIQGAIITAPAIYAEATKRKIIVPPSVPMQMPVPVWPDPQPLKVTGSSKSATIKKQEPGPPGVRRIDLDEE